MQSKYQEIKILENYIQNMNCFSWIKLIPVLIHLTYWNYVCPYLELPCLPHHLCQSLSQPTEATIKHNPHHVVHWFLYLSYPIRPHTTTSIGYTKPYAKQNQSNLLSSYIQIMIFYGSNTLPIKKLSL